jgi:hypothetical protein
MGELRVLFMVEFIFFFVKIMVNIHFEPQFLPCLLNIYIQGSTVLHLYFNHYKHLMMHIPESVDGQREISNYLALIDEHQHFLLEQHLESTNPQP